MEEKSLVILAAGMGSRFGGMKQVEPVGPNDEFIMDYSIYSAIKYGFNKIIFVIREEYLDLFKSSIGKRIEGKVNVEYVFQDINDIPDGFRVPDGRVKPWGTAHAIYSARKYINGPFGVINADDFYGNNAFKELSDALDEEDYVIVGYPIGETLSDNGSVKRGVIIHENGLVKSITECACSKEGNKAKCVPLDESKESFLVDLNNPVSMLINGFNPNLLEYISKEMNSEFASHEDSLDTYEMLLPDIMEQEIHNGRKIKVIKTTSIWIGMTYKEDKVNVEKFILNEIDKGVYPKNLWQ